MKNRILLSKKDRLFLTAFFPLVFSIIGSVIVFGYGYGYKPLILLNYNEGIVDTVLVKNTSSSRHSRTSGLYIVLINSKIREFYPVVIFNKNKQDEIVKSILIGSKAKIWHFNPRYSTNNVVFAEFDNGYKVSLHSKQAGAIVFYTFIASVIMLLIFGHKWVSFKD
jgi:hypothetical protein